MLGNSGRQYESGQTVERAPPALSRLHMTPPVDAIRISAVPLPHRPDVFPDVSERSLVKRGDRFRHLPAEIDDPLARGTASQVHAVDPGFQYIGVGPAVRIGREAQPLASQIAGNVERPALGVAHEGNADVLRNPRRPGQVESGRAALPDAICSPAFTNQ